MCHLDRKKKTRRFEKRMVKTGQQRDKECKVKRQETKTKEKA